MNSPADIAPPPAGTVLAGARAAIERHLLDKPQTVRLALACILARGHLLIEDLPGLGKTLLAQALATTLGLDFRRVQFTSDLLPGDLLGCAVFDRGSGRFDFREGPVFTQVLLADEINRASPKTQSALLEAMEERQVSIEGQTRRLSAVFFVLATQNPLDQHGVFPLPEAQLDRFLMRLSIGYPSPQAELELLGGEDRRALLARQPALLDGERLLALQGDAATLHASPALLAYIHALLTETRLSGLFRHGLSPRAGQALLAAARAWALLDGRDHVLPADVQAVLPAVADHRLQPAGGGDSGALLARIVAAVPLP
ncbi:AAA family ATPase [Pseudothauera rhizosphaerae]|uniref:AAA family ATPase n=1 Tax=Pseudothauera rhizosphaerae TaxID=2565932 RepID=A0A4S4AVU1_9RHOO|nr:AAA family ATPase [Pseudothauera rhizosphaerae]THF62676.1 AAA family ATPase [Pseudothauera rhizosphaerae]